MGPLNSGKMSLVDIHDLIQHKILHDFQVDIKRFPRIKVEIEMIDCEYMGLKRFRELVTSYNVDDVYERTYYIVQMNKQPLFYCDKGSFGLVNRVKRWVSEHGHFSVILGSCKGENEHECVMVVDGDSKFGEYMVAVERLHEAVRCRDHKGKCGGLLKITAHSIL